MKAWKRLENGMGAIDWSGFPVVVDLLGVTDVETLVDDLLVIKDHRPPK